jgi:hypothetical protein
MTAGGDDAPSQAFADEAFAVAVNAYSRTPESWAQAIHAAIGSLFEFLTDQAAQTRACIVDDCGASRAALERRDQTIERFTALLQPGMAMAAVPPPPIVAEAIGGGIYEIVRSHVLERRLEQLPVATSDATIVALAPFLGSEAAIELVSTKNVQAGR